MKQAVMIEPGRIEFRNVDPPSAGAGEVLLRVRRIGVCGSDVHVWHGKHPYTSYPVVQGHEFSGTIEQLGEGVEGFVVGIKATALPQVVCGRCWPCLRGDYHICDSLKVEGFQAPGCGQELFAVPAERVVALPAGFTFEQGAMVEPTAVAVHAVGRAGGIAGQNVAVLGAGPIGNLVGQVARSEGAKVLITDLSDFRLSVACDCGLERTSNASKETLAEAVSRVFGEAGFATAFECAGAAETISAAIETIGKGGTIVAVGVFAEQPKVNVGFVQDRELQVRGTLMYQRADYDQAVKLIASGAVRTEPLITKHFGFADYVAAYEHIDQVGDKVMKVFIDL